MLLLVSLKSSSVEASGYGVVTMLVLADGGLKVEVTSTDNGTDLLAVLREQGSARHGEVLEWIGEFDCSRVRR